MRRPKMIIIFALMLFLGGCIQKEILDEVNLITVMGYDKGENGGIIGTVVVPQYSKDQPIDNKILKVEGDLSRDIMSQLQKESPDPLVYGKLQFVLYQRAVAEQGIQPLIDSIERDASVGSRLILAVSNDNVFELLSNNYGQLGNAVYLSNLVRQNMNLRDIPENNLHLFLYSLYTDGRDPVMPIMEQNGQDNIRITGVALFQKDRMVGEIENKQMPFLKLLMGESVKGTHPKDLENNEIASIESIKSKRKMTYVKEKPAIEIELTIKGHVREYSKGKITPKDIKKLESAMEKEIEKESSVLIEQFKELEVDPVGFGEFIKSRSRGEKKSDWTKEYLQTEINVKADVTIIETGVVE
ncbi:Ger(x)C family spore germination protein [Bacillus kexueae]|uniref:Ger(x)C family spore germination protein n=1 Tax=Aeribacillus kexueae TaxID=2078952 RepID=UPI001FAFF2DD|nr:Ger(x)C family spore germination protein [Bacillus kexueae]